APAKEGSSPFAAVKNLFGLGTEPAKADTPPAGKAGPAPTAPAPKSAYTPTGPAVAQGPTPKSPFVPAAPAAAPSPAGAAPPAPYAAGLGKVPADKTDTARQLLAQGRKAMQNKDLTLAQQLAERAHALRPELQWWEDNPDKLLADVNRQLAAAP